MENNIFEFLGKKPGSPEEDKSHEFGRGLDVGNLTEMLLYLTALKKSSGPPKMANVELRRRELVAPSSDQELMDMANNSSEGDWQSHPTYYDAIIAELRNRNLIPSRKNRD